MQLPPQLERVIVVALRYIQAAHHAAKALAPNKRFMNLNIAVGLLVAIVLLQSFVISHLSWGTSSAADANPLMMLKGEVYSSHYDRLLKAHNPQKLKALPLRKRCQYFFDSMAQNKPNWKLADFDTTGHDDNTYTWEEFLSYWKSQHKDQVVDDKKLEELEIEYNEKAARGNKVSNKVIDYIGVMRIFNQCYLEDSIGPSTLEQIKGYWKDDGEDKMSTCVDAEARVYPWLTNILPTYKRWDGTISVGLPDLSDEFDYDRGTDVKFGVNGDDNHEKRNEKGHCFFKTLKESINGKGFVLTASDKHVGDVKKLGVVLRTIGNKAPIQIVHQGDLSPENQESLIKAFRSEVNTTALGDLYEEYDIYGADMAFPKQDLWFVDVKASIKPDFAKFFTGYSNKLLAYLFNSFEDMILIDTDTVPFVRLDEKIFNYQEYKDFGTYFFHDREVKGQNSPNVINFYHRLFPSKLDHYFFGIPEVTDFTLNNRFLGDLRNHYMESGVVAVNRKEHFSGMLSSVQLNFWNPINNGRIHGDKELFWLGMSIAGDEQYFFNKPGAASVGELTPQANKRFPKALARELCSNHPGHIDGHDMRSLLWINSGMTFCKNLQAAEEDSTKPLYKGRFTSVELKAYYQSVTKIRAAIIPPAQEITGTNEDGNPDMGWTDEYKYCAWYTWCAYDFVGNGELEEQNGKYIEFNSLENKWFDFIGGMWMGGLPESAFVTSAASPL